MEVFRKGDQVFASTFGLGFGSYARAHTHKGEYLGLAPTGKKVTMKAFSIYRIVDTKVVEMWTVADMLDFYKELGVIEYKGFPDEVNNPLT